MSTARKSTPSLAAQVREIGQKAKAASAFVALQGEAAKNAVLKTMASELRHQQATILKANQKDLSLGKKAGLTKALLDRLTLNEKRIQGMVEGLEVVSALPDPIGEVMSGWRRPNGLSITQVRVPLGAVGMIYESRPNVTIDAAALCLKSGNAAVLKGGKEAFFSNQALAAAAQAALKKNGWPVEAVSLIPFTDRAATQAMMGLRGVLDVLIPRGGQGLIRAVVQNAKLPTLETGVGNCHLFVDESADLDKALAILVNAKTQRPGVCNAIETLLVHRAVAAEFLPRAKAALDKHHVELRGCPATRKIISAKPAKPADWATEYLDLILAIRVVADVEEAITHIREYGTQHSETILTRNMEAAERFSQAIDAADIFINASSRFADGGEYGFGAEIGISTQKLHARGPMGLKALTTYKYIVRGDGQTRP